MRLLILAPQDFYIDRGTPIDVDILVRALSMRGHTIDLVTYRAGEDRDYPGLTIHRPRSPGFLRPPGPGFSIRKVLTNFWFFVEARRLIRSVRYDVVHAGEEAVYMAMWFRRRYGVPYVYDMDSSVAQQLVEKMPWLRPVAGVFDFCERQAIRGALAVAPVCNALASLARSGGAEHVVTLHDISQIQPHEPSGEHPLREKLGIDERILMYVGNFQEYQGVDLLLEAFARARELGCRAHLVLAGGSEQNIATYRKMSGKLRIRDHTHFLGHWPVERLGELLSAADVVASPRIRGVNTPMKVFPYLHSERPLLATDLPTHNQILTPRIAHLAPPNPEDFGEAILELMEDGELRRRLGRAGREFVESNHVFEAHQQRVDMLYEYVEAHRCSA